MHAPLEWSRVIDALRTREGATLESATRSALVSHGRLATEAMDHIGSWPSSEPEYRELQRQWMRL